MTKASSQDSRHGRTAADDRSYYARNREQIRARDLGRNRRYRELYADQIKGRSRQARREFAEQIARIKLEAGCVDCDYNQHPAALHFDHVRGQKRMNISTMARRPWDVVLAEIAKCEVRCANCHAIQTYERGQYAIAAEIGNARRRGVPPAPADPHPSLLDPEAPMI